MKKFIKENWFKIAIIIILLVVASAYALGQYAYYQKQQTQIQLLDKEEQEELKLKSEIISKIKKRVIELKGLNSKDAQVIAEEVYQKEFAK